MTPIHSHGHKHSFTDSRTTLVQTGIRNFHATQLRNQRLVFIKGLQRALTGLRLVRRVSSVKLSPRCQFIHNRRNKVVVDPATKETQATTTNDPQPPLQILRRFRELGKDPGDWAAQTRSEG